MQQNRLGSSGLKVSELGLGTMTWGRQTSEPEAKEQLTAFLDAGGNLVDTAVSYADGDAELILGRLIAGGVHRDDLVIATKAGITRKQDQRHIDTSRGQLLRCLDTSLRRLNIANVDLWQVHIWSDETPIAETLSALEIAVSSGRAAHVGISNYSGWQTAHAATLMSSRIPLAATQNEYSLLNRGAETEVIPAAAALGLGVLAWSPLGRGVLTGKYRTGIPTNSRGGSDSWSGFIEPYLSGNAVGIVEATQKAAEGLGWEPLQVALAWLKAQPGLTAPIVGARDLKQLTASLKTTDLHLPPELISALTDVSDLNQF